MEIYRIDKVDENVVRVVDFFDPGKVIEKFYNKKQGFYFEGDVVYYDKIFEEYLFVNNADAQLGSLIINQLTKNGNIKYADMNKESQIQYDKAIELIDHCYKEPKLLDRSKSYNFAAQRLAELMAARGEL